MSKDIEREAFERYARSKGRYIQISENTGKYVSMTLNEEWEAWQAAKAHEAEKLKGKVVVPVEPTQAMLDAVRSEHEGEPYLPHSLYKSFLKAATVEAARGENEKF